MLVRRGDCRRLPAPRSNGLSGETCPEERGRADYSPPKYSPIGNTVYTVEPKGLLRRKCGPGLTAAGGRPRYTDDPLVGSVNRGEFVTPLKGRTKMAVREDRRYLDEDILHNLAQKQGDDDDDDDDDDDNERDESVGRTPRGTTTTAYDLDGRRVKREGRQRPWVPKKGGRQHKDKYIIETHYESYLPTDKWYRLKPFSYVNNPTWGDAFQVRRRVGKPFRPETQDWLVENDFRIWLFEKSKDRKQLNFPDTVSTKQTFYAATVIQKMARGWLYRTRVTKLKRKLFMEHAIPYQRFKNDYRSLLVRVQKRNGVRRPSAPFDVDQASHFLDRKAKYDRAFRSVAVDGRLKKNTLKSFFKECGLNPTQRDINTAYTNVFEGEVGRAEVVFVVDCSIGVREVEHHAQMDFITTVIGSLPVGQQLVRVGYVPYNTDVLQSFGLGTFDDKNDAIVAIKFMESKVGVTRTDLALKTMRQMMQEARPRVAKTAILLTDGKTCRPGETAREARHARADDVVIVGVGESVSVGVGSNVDKAMLAELATSPSHVFSVADYEAINEIKARVLRYLPRGDTDSGGLVEETGRGLLQSEALELLWTIYPPEGTGLDTYKRSTWMRPLVDEEEICSVEGESEADFETCLKTVFQSQLERDGEIMMPKGEREVERVTKWELAMQRAREFINRERMKREETQERTRILSAYKDKRQQP
ncbi:hypothetical protein LSAT2_006009 [Lamellibrachia satsuma]|nr:hypothetical protein LSAT2_006009 [Lamellibrachia satsuma]